MRLKLPGSKFALAVVTVLSSVLFLPGQETGSSAKKPYIPTGSEALVSGSISFAGEPQKPLEIDMSADPVCYQVNPNLRTEWLVVSNGKLANVGVYVKGTVLESYSFDLPTSSVLLERKGCRVVPHVLGMRVGQPLMMLNSDPTVHNCHPTPKKNQEWNYSQPPGADPLIKTFNLPEAFIPFKCNQHPWEKGYIGVFTHPFFAVSDENGNYKIEGLPPGQYTLIAWHERLGEKTVDVTLSPGKETVLDFTFEAAKP